MTVTFYKYQGTGNDFVIIDNRAGFFPKTNHKLVQNLCDRHLGIGADGLILLENDDTSDFGMVYFNSDGKEGSMCGNGGRCIVAFAEFLGVIQGETTFKAVDGLHQATLSNGIVSLKMQDVDTIIRKPHYFFLDTGSPHHVQLISHLDSLDVKKEGAKIRYGLYGASGSNVNFVEQKTANQFYVRTYERGVEDETLSCGTGVTAVALAMFANGMVNDPSVHIITEGGELRVDFISIKDRFENICLTGPATLVYKGTVEI